MFTARPLKRLYGAVCGAVSDKVLIGDKTEGVSFRLFIESGVLFIRWSNFEKAGIGLMGKNILGRADGQVSSRGCQVFAAEIVRAENKILFLVVSFPGRIDDDGIRGIGQGAAERAGFIVQVVGFIDDMVKAGIACGIEVVDHLAGAIAGRFIFSAAGLDRFEFQQSLNGNNKRVIDNMCAHIEQGAGIIENKQREFPLFDFILQFEKCRDILNARNIFLGG